MEILVTQCGCRPVSCCRRSVLWSFQMIEFFHKHVLLCSSLADAPKVPIACTTLDLASRFGVFFVSSFLSICCTFESQSRGRQWGEGSQAFDTTNKYGKSVSFHLMIRRQKMDAERSRTWKVAYEHRGIILCLFAINKRLGLFHFQPPRAELMRRNHLFDAGSMHYSNHRTAELVPMALTLIACRSSIIAAAMLSSLVFWSSQHHQFVAVYYCLQKWSGRCCNVWLCQRFLVDFDLPRPFTFSCSALASPFILSMRRCNPVGVS